MSVQHERPGENESAAIDYSQYAAKEIDRLRDKLAEANARAERHKALADHMIENEAACMRTLQAFDKSDGHATESIVELATAAVARIARLQAECRFSRRKLVSTRGGFMVGGILEDTLGLHNARADVDAHGDLDQKPHAEGAD